MKGINLPDEVVVLLDRWAVVPHDMKSRFDIGQRHSCGLLPGSSMMGADFVRRGKTFSQARLLGAKILKYAPSVGSAWIRPCQWTVPEERMSQPLQLD